MVPCALHKQSWLRHSAVSTGLLALLLLVYLAAVEFYSDVAPVKPEHEETSAYGKPEEPSDFSAPVQKLLSDLKAAIRIAESEGLPFTYAATEKQQWMKENPCRARSELPELYAARKHVKNVEPNYQWEAVLAQYSNLHRTCISKISNLTDYFLSESEVPGCKFITGESVFGLGNKITYTASVVLYAILTQRVVLFYKGTSAIPVLCEPFEGSSWELPSSLNYINKRQKTSPNSNVNEARISNVSERFLDWIDREKANGDSSHGTIDKLEGGIYHTVLDNGWDPLERFFCRTEQEFLSQVPWLSITGCLYFLPKLFAVTSFRPILEGLFPDRMALTHVLRSVFLPNNIAWDRIQRNHDLFLRRADKLVSIQVRYRWGADEYSQFHDSVNPHIMRCLVENDILPNVSESRVYDPLNPKYALGDSTRSRTKVLITSLYTDLHDILQEMYLRHPTVTGESVGIIQLTHDDDQRWGLEPDIEALVEIVLLSLSDKMLVTPLSTFGGVAQAYGGLKPWIVDHQTKAEGSCTRASSVDICYQGAPESFSCPHDLDVHEKNIHEQVPYIDKCLDIDSPNGLLLITTDQGLSTESLSTARTEANMHVDSIGSEA